MNDKPGDKNDNVENMALADLLGMAEGSDDGRVQERDDEPGSGIAQLSMMVSTTSIEDAKKPSISPNPIVSPTSEAPAAAASVPAGSMAPPAGSVPPGGMAPPMGSVPPGSMAPPMGSVPPNNTAPPMGTMPDAAAQAVGYTQPDGTAAGYQPTEAAAAQTVPNNQAVAQTMPNQAVAAQTMPNQAVAQTGIPQQTAQMPTETEVTPPKSKTGLFIGIGGGAIALIGTVMFLVMGGGDKQKEQDAQVAQLQAKLDALAEKQAAPVEKGLSDTPATPRNDAPSENVAAAAAGQDEAKDEAKDDNTAAVAANGEAAEEKAEEAEETEEAEEKTPVKPANMTKAQRRKWARAQKAAKKAAAKKAKAQKKAAKTQKATAKAEPKKKGGSALGSLLDNDVASGKKSAAGKLPETPSRNDVKNAMKPIQAKAKTCAKYAKGTVKLKVVVGKNGRVKSSNVVGGTAQGNAANCVAMIARTAKFPKFSNPTFSFNYPVTLK